MLEVYICEDEKDQREKLVRMINDSIKKLKYPMKVVLATDKPKEIIESVTNVQNDMIFFLDIDLKAPYNGFELAKKIQLNNKNASFVFVTSYADLAILTYEYEIKTIDYIVKGGCKNIELKVEKCLGKFYKKVRDKEKCSIHKFVLELKDKSIVEDMDQIVAFSTIPNSHKITMHSVNRILQFYATLSDVIERLSQNFYRCNESVIVNKNYIDSVDKKTRIITMKDGSEYEASVRRIKGLIIS